ncbi:MAG: hypothetical protein GEU75_08840 [Dehalococcoidia bacterium]|nr:hypothetical protein [Dehalococcoidia bacterium]
MKLYLVRHGEAAWPSGWSPEDVGLAAGGRAQSEAAGRELARRVGAGPVTLLSSPARRAIETAAVIGEALRQQVETETALVGLTDHELRHRFYESGIDGALASEIDAIGGAAWPEVVRRAEGAEADASIIAVSHDVTIGGIVCRVLSMPITDLRRFRVDQGSISVIDFRPQRTILASLNEVEHLKAPTPA